jgi:5,10-methylenetetrahydromethanopterin reductase
MARTGKGGETLRFSLEILLNKPIEEVVSISKLAEDRGFDMVWTSDHFPNRTIYPALTAIALNTKKILIGPGATNPYVIHPAWTASAMYSLNELSGGRAVLGFVPGDKVTLSYLNIKWGKSLATMHEAVSIIRRLLNGGKVDFQGEIFKLENARMNYSPPSPTIPIYIGAQGPKMLKLAGKLGDGVLINASHPKDMRNAVKIIKAGVDDAGRDLKELDIVAWTCFSVGHSSHEAQEKAKDIVAFILASAPPSIAYSHGISSDEVEMIKKAIAVGNFNSMRELVNDNMIKAFSISGDVAECKKKIKKLARTGVTHIAVGSPVGVTAAGGIDIISKNIIPAFKGKGADDTSSYMCG